MSARFWTLAPNQTHATLQEPRYDGLVEIGPPRTDLAVAAARKAFDKGKWSLETPASRARELWKVAKQNRLDKC